VKRQPLAGSRALWNRSRLDLDSDEILAQLMDRGEMAVWRELYARARSDVRLRERMHRTVRTVPLSLPRFWLALLAGLGESVDYDAEVPAYDAGP
jgi:hypothetical protein